MSDSEQVEQLEILIKPSRGEKKTVNVAATLKVLELKEQLAVLYDIPASNQRLIYSGRILKDNDALSAYSIKNGHALHLVKGSAKSGAPTPAVAAASTASGSPAPPASGTAAGAAPSGVPANLAAGSGTGNVLSDLTGARYAGFANLPSASMFGPDGGMGPAPDVDQLLSMMERPGFSEAMQQLLADPEALSQMSPMLDSMPPAQARQFREFLATPEFRQLMSDPQALRQMFQQAQMLRSYFGTAGQDAGALGSFPMPGSGESGESGEARSGAGAGAAANPWLSMFNGGAAGAAAGAGGAGQMPDFSALLGSGAFGQGGFGQAAAEDSRPPEERYERQLAQLNELGFYDFDRNVRALRRSGGNVEGAIDALLDGNF